MSLVDIDIMIHISRPQLHCHPPSLPSCPLRTNLYLSKQYSCPVLPLVHLDYTPWSSIYPSPTLCGSSHSVKMESPSVRELFDGNYRKAKTWTFNALHLCEWISTDVSPLYVYQIGRQNRLNKPKRLYMPRSLLEARHLPKTRFLPYLPRVLLL